MQGSKVLGTYREFPGQPGQASRPSLEPGMARTVLNSPVQSWVFLALPDPGKHMVSLEKSLKVPKHMAPSLG